MNKHPSPKNWNTKALALLGAYASWMLVLAHKAHEAYGISFGHFHDKNPFCHVLGCHRELQRG
jgi:hypothetical protein